MTTANNFPRGRVLSPELRKVRVIGSFQPFLGDDDHLHFDFKNSGGCVQLDTVVESHTTGDEAGRIILETVADQASANASLTCAGTHIDTVIQVVAAGTAGNAWKIALIPHTHLGLGVSIVEDNTLKRAWILFEDGVSDMADVETALGGTTYIEVGTGGAATGALTAAADSMAETAMAGGLDTVDIDVVNVGSGKGSLHEVTIHFEPSVATVTELETAIAALSGTDDVIDIRTAGTGAAVLATPDDVMAKQDMLSWKAPAQVGRGFYVVREGDGLYDVVLLDKYRKVLGFSGQVRGAAAAHPLKVEFGSSNGDLVDAITQLPYATKIGDRQVVPLKIKNQASGGGAVYGEAYVTTSMRVDFHIDLIP